MSVRAIYDAVHSGTYESARALIQSELSKDPKNPVYLGLQALNEENSGHRARASDAAQQAAAANPPLAVIRNFLVPILIRHNDAQLLNSTFEGANRRDPNNTELARLWYDAMFDLAYLRGVHKALVAMLKLNPDERYLKYGVVYVMTLVWDATPDTQPEKRLFPMLAERMLEKVLPPASAQELFVAAKALQMSSVSKMTDLLLQYTQWGDSLLELQILLIEGLEASERWTKLWSSAAAQLKSGIDSFTLWQALNKAAIALGRQEELETFASNFHGNNRHYAKIDLAERESKQIESAVDAYWTAMQTKACAYEFMLPYSVPAEAGPSLVAQTTLSKLKYASTGEADVSSLIKLHAGYLATDRPVEITDYYAGSDALIVAALSLIDTRLIKAVAILEYASDVDPHHFQVRLWLVLLHRRLGAESRALTHWNALSLKNIQQETLQHLLGTRIATTISPAAAQRAMLASKTVHESETANIGKYAAVALERGVFTQVGGIMELSRVLKASLSQAITAIELVKAERLGRKSQSLEAITALPLDTSDLIDNRDFSVLYNPRNVSWSTGPVPGREWVALQRDCELMFASALAGRDLGIDIEKFLVSVDAATELTSIEKWSLRATASLLKRERPATPPLLPSEHEMWEFLHWGYTILDIQKRSDDFAARYKLSKLRCEFNEEVKRACTNATSAIQQQQQPDVVELDKTFTENTIAALKQSQLQSVRNLDATASALTKKHR